VEIEKYRHDLEVIRNTAKQLYKDFELKGNEIFFSGNEKLAYKELERQILPLLKELFQNNQNRFMNVMYRIDVNENDIRKALGIEDKKAAILAVAGLVLEREFIKCVTKKVFAQKSNI
jgi:hypothetical protein